MFSGRPSVARRLAHCSEKEPDYLLGFVLTIIAGMATCLGSVAILFAKMGGNPKKVTSAAMGFAAGVMMWVSFIDILGTEAVQFFEHHFHPPDCGSGRRLSAGVGEGDGGEGGETICVRLCVAGFFFVGVLAAIGLDKCVDAMFSNQENVEEGDSDSSEALNHHDSQKVSSLERISFVTFLALTIHNFPEGLATFFGGGTGSFAVPVAIAMHNIPEGMAIAVPFYQSSGSVWGAVKNTFWAGLAQPIGAAFGWFLIAICRLEGLPPFVYGAVYASTAGVMVCVSIMELLPEAFAGATPMFVSLWVFAGFALMECSIICLNASGA